MWKSFFESEVNVICNILFKVHSSKFFENDIFYLYLFILGVLFEIVYKNSIIKYLLRVYFTR